MIMVQFWVIELNLPRGRSNSKPRAEIEVQNPVKHYWIVMTQYRGRVWAHI